MTQNSIEESVISVGKNKRETLYDILLFKFTEL